jgi:hypothetical protein
MKFETYNVERNAFILVYLMTLSIAQIISGDAKK